VFEKNLESVNFLAKGLEKEESIELGTILNFRKRETYFLTEQDRKAVHSRTYPKMNDALLKMLSDELLILERSDAGEFEGVRHSLRGSTPNPGSLLSFPYFGLRQNTRTRLSG